MLVVIVDELWKKADEIIAKVQIYSLQSVAKLRLTPKEMRLGRHRILGVADD